MHLLIFKVRKRAKIRHRYNQAPYLTQDTNEKVITSQSDITNENLLVIDTNGRKDQWQEIKMSECDICCRKITVILKYN